MDAEENNETDGQSSGQRGLQAQVVIISVPVSYRHYTSHTTVLASSSNTGLMSCQ